MPQMAPLSWMLMFSLFSIILILNSSIMYFQNNNNPKSLKNNKIQLMNWKW